MTIADAIRRLAIASDERTAWADAVDSCQALFWRIAVRMLGADAAADAVQDSLLALRAAARRFRPGRDAEASAVAWAARIAVNTCHQHRRRMQRAAAAWPVAAMAAPDDHAADAETRAAVQAALAELPADQREAIQLRYVAELDFQAVAAATRVKSGTARMRVQRGLEALRGVLVRRGIAISALGLASILDGVAAEAVALPSPTLVASWKSATLTPLATAISTGSLAMLSALCAASIAVTISLATPDTPAPGPAASDVAPAAESTLSLTEWLKRQRNPDLTWGDAASLESRTQTTSRVVLMLLGSGYNHIFDNPDAPLVGPAMAWLVAHPYLGDDVITSALYAMVFAETEAMTNDAQLNPHAEAACARLAEMQHGDGWPARRGGPGINLPVTAFAITAMKSASIGLRTIDYPSLLRGCVNRLDAFVAEQPADSLLPSDLAILPSGAWGRTDQAAGNADAEAAAIFIHAMANSGKTSPAMAARARRLSAAGARDLDMDSMWLMCRAAIIGGEHATPTWLAVRADQSRQRRDVPGHAMALLTRLAYDTAALPVPEPMHFQGSITIGGGERAEPPPPPPRPAAIY